MSLLGFQRWKDGNDRDIGEGGRGGLEGWKEEGRVEYFNFNNNFWIIGL